MAGATVLPWVVMREGHKGSSCADVGSSNSYVAPFCAITQKVHSARWRFASSRDGSRRQTPSVGEERKPRHAGAAKIMRDDVYARRATIPRLHVEAHARRVARQREKCEWSRVTQKCTRKPSSAERRWRGRWLVFALWYVDFPQRQRPFPRESSRQLKMIFASPVEERSKLQTCSVTCSGFNLLIFTELHFSFSFLSVAVLHRTRSHWELGCYL